VLVKQLLDVLCFFPPLLLQISYTATSITLSDKQRFPTFLRTISSDNASIALLQDLVAEYQWRQVAIISTNNDNFGNVSWAGRPKPGTVPMELFLLGHQLRVEVGV